MIAREDQTPENTTVLMFCVPPFATEEMKREIVSGLLDQVNERNRAAGGEDLEIGDILEDTDFNGVYAKKIVLHGLILDESLKMPNVFAEDEESEPNDSPST